MLEEVMKLPRKSPESTDLHRWAMLRMAINEDRCISLVNVAKPKKKKAKERQPQPISSLFRDLPSMTAVRTWKSKVGGDIRQRYGGGGVEWASGLTDSAYLMYGIPRATLKQDLKQRHLRKKANPRIINHSQSFSEYATPSQLGVSEQPRDRHSMAGHSIESSVSSLSSAPSSPGEPSPQPVPHHLPPNSVSVLPRSNPKLVSLNHVEANLDLYSSKGALVSARTKLEPNWEYDQRRHSMPCPSRLSPNSEVVRNSLVPSIQENKVKEEEKEEEMNNNNDNGNNVESSINDNSDNNNNNNSSGGKLNSSLDETLTKQRAPSPPTFYIPEAPKIERERSPLNTMKRPVIIGQYNNNNNVNSTNGNIFAEIDATKAVVEPRPIPPAPMIPINKRPPQPAPKPKNRRAQNNKFNMAPLQAALIGSLNKRFKAPKITS